MSDATNFSRRNYTISMAKANVYSLLVTAPVILPLVLVYVGVWWFWQPMGAAPTEGIWRSGGFENALVALLIFLAIFMVGIVVHEGIHGITWKLLTGKPWSAIHFGFQVRTLTPYAHCKEPMPARAYRIGALMPGVITGLLPALAGIVTGNYNLFFLGILFVLAAGGDLLIVYLIRKIPGDWLVEDHPSEAGCIVLEPCGEPQS